MFLPRQQVIPVATVIQAGFPIRDQLQRTLSDHAHVFCLMAVRRDGGACRVAGKKYRGLVACEFAGAINLASI